MPNAEQITGADAVHGEGPVWSPSWGGLRWVDMLNGDVLHLNADGSVDRWHVASVAAAIRPRIGGGLVIASERSFLLADTAGGKLTAMPDVFTDERIRFNEGSCDPAGSFLVGTMAYDETPGMGTIYRLRPDGQVDTAVANVTVSNGLAWTTDGATAFYVDTATNRIDRFEWNPEQGLHNRRAFVTIEAAHGHPDGLTLDAEGGIWIALWEGSAVQRYDASGHLDHVLDLPVPKVTACTFGGDNLDRLYITTSSYGNSGEDARSGALFCSQPGVRGRPVAEYLG